MLVPVIPEARKKEETVNFHLSERPCGVFFWPVFNTQNKINKFSLKKKKRIPGPRESSGDEPPQLARESLQCQTTKGFLVLKVSKGSKVGSMPGDQAPCTRGQVGGH